MTLQEATISKRVIKENLQIFGQCKILSQGDECKCALCQLARLDTNQLMLTVERCVEKGLAGLENDEFDFKMS